MSLISYLKYILKRKIYPNCYSSERYVEFLREQGAVIGNGTYFYTPEKHPVDESSLPFLEIGCNCRITQDAYILLHDYSYAVLRFTHHEMLRKSGKVKIGNNVFIGTRATILVNSEIGDNCIIGAGSVVSGKFESNVVIAGNPARVICTIDEYYKKLKVNFEKSAKEFYCSMSEYRKRPLREDEMSWYVSLWKTIDLQAREEMLRKIRIDGDEADLVVADVMKSEPVYESYNEFLASFNHRY